VTPSREGRFIVRGFREKIENGEKREKAHNKEGRKERESFYFVDFQRGLCPNLLSGRRVPSVKDLKIIEIIAKGTLE